MNSEHGSREERITRPDTNGTNGMNLQIVMDTVALLLAAHVPRGNGVRSALDSFHSVPLDRHVVRRVFHGLLIELALAFSFVFVLLGFRISFGTLAGACSAFHLSHNACNSLALAD